MNDVSNIFLHSCDGIAFWAGIDPPIAVARTRTLTVFSWRREAVLERVGAVLTAIEDAYNSVLRCHTEGYPSPGGLVQRYKQEKERVRPVAGFERLVGRETERRIYCSISRLAAPFDTINPELWSDPRRTAVILVELRHQEAALLWDALAPYDEFLTPAAADAVLSRHAGTLFCSCYEDGCTHFAWQIIGPAAEIDRIAALPALAGLRRVASHDEIAVAIGGAELGE